MLVLLPLLLLLLATASSPSPAAGAGGATPVVNPFSYFCNSTAVRRTYLPNSTFAANLATLAAALPRNASASPGGVFSAGAFGATPSTAYGLVLCRGDLTGDACASCLEAPFRDADAHCPYSSDVTVYHDQCQLRFSDRDFLAGAGAGDANMPESVAWNMNNVSDGAAAAFNDLVVRLLGAVAGATANTTGRYATGQAGFRKERMNVYALAQCTPDLTPAQCRGCLAGLIGQVPTWLTGRVGGRILGVRCDIRYENEVFFARSRDMVTLTPLVDTSKGKTKDHALLIIATVYSAAVLCTRLIFWLLSIRRKQKRRKMDSMEQLENFDEVLRLWRIEDSNLDFSLYDVSQIADATDNFSPNNILGEGGFGPVYKGVFPDGQVVAIKRLSARSRQGLVEFKNEIQVIAKLQHKNLVRLLGCCIHEEEKMLIYEYLTNKSLDHFIFDPIRRASLKWKTRIRIIEGIAQGLLYLHNHSRLRIVHRDLKASNILLDSELNPKISDFGMARIFPSDATQAKASRIVGTYGYMAPEYASDGLLSIKSDVFSFGVLLLEIITGKRSSGFQHHGEFYNLLEYAWELWKDRRWNEFVDQSSGGEYEPWELNKCLTVALMCVQEKATDRPTMPDVVAMLSSDGINLPEPGQPAYTYMRLDASVNIIALCSRNDITITTANGR